MPRQRSKQVQGLQVLELQNHSDFEEPKKCINEGTDVPFFLTSKAYSDLMSFLLQLNTSMFPRQKAEDIDTAPTSSAVEVLGNLLHIIDGLIDEAPPEPGPRRFGNVAFRKWYELLETQASDLLAQHLPTSITSLESWKNAEHSPLLEIKAYLLGSFGNAKRLDYGSGHELSFLAFLGCIWKLGGFNAEIPEAESKSIVLNLIGPYLDIIRRLITTYNLEPAGSHGVWGLDDHSFIPYIFGSAQLAPAIADANRIPAEGSSPDAPDPGDVVKADVVQAWRDRNLYFGAIGFIYDVKKGPFWEHSPMLFDISGVKAGWAKINKGMIKMYAAEVLAKFPVVQHFPFGRLFRWERDPNAVEGSISSSTVNGQQASGNMQPTPPTSNGSTAAPWAKPANAAPLQAAMRAPWANQSATPRDMRTPTSGTRQQTPLRHPPQPGPDRRSQADDAAWTKAPWAK